VGFIRCVVIKLIMSLQCNVMHLFHSVIPMNKNTLFQNYNQLVAEWASTRRGAGGVNAIKGFNFQLLSAIKKIALVNNLNTIVTTEEISDITEFNLNTIIITQAKYCITSGSVTSALNELWDIYNLIIKSYPSLIGFIEFKILGQRKQLNNVEKSIVSWKKRKSSNDNKSDIDSFVKKVSATVESNPYEEIIQLLIVEYSAENPWAIVDGWIGKLYKSISNGTVESICTDIRFELQLFKNKKRSESQKLSFYLWQESDLPPVNIKKEEDLHKACIVGENPRKSHLIEGRFASRGIYNDIYQTFCSWLENNNEKSGGKLPVFWISGRSGSGKSVALLHLLSMIKSGERESIVAWFGNKPSSLNSFLPYLDELCEYHEKSYLCFDDPYVYERQEIFDKNVLLLADLAERLVDKDLELNIPFILCCGPDEQLDWCEDNLGDYLEIKKYRLRDENRNDIEEIKKWYEKRTGVSVPQSNDSNEMLLVQALFEWSSNETLKDFARNFRKRLSDNRWDHQNISPFEFVSNVLAVNRLYALFPIKKVDEICEADPKLAKAIYQLEKDEHHLTLKQDDLGVKLTHPHLADVLYREWYGNPSDSQFRKNHLRDWISFVEKESFSAKSSLLPLWVIEKLSNPNFKGEGSTIPRINLVFDDIKAILPSFYEKHVNLDAPLSYLPVWTSLDYNFKLQLEPSPLNLIGENLIVENIDEIGFRLSCHKVIEYYEFSNTLSREHLHLILRSCKNWRGWSYVFFDYVRRLGINNIEDVILELIQNDPENPTLIKISHYICRISPKVDDKVQRVMGYWLEACNVNVPSWVANFTDFAKCYVINLKIKDKAKYFLRKNYDNKSWSHVWEALWISEVGNSELEELARSWLRLRICKDAGWSFVWEKLAQSLPIDQELIDIGFEYLEGENSSKSKKIVWNILREQNADNLRLEEFAKDWLLKTPVWHREWIYLWTKVIEDFKKDDEIILLGRDWLYQVSVSHSTWVYTLTRVLKHLPFNKKLQGKTVLWLEFNSIEDESWQYLWELAWKNNSRNKLLAKLGVTWLQKTSFSHARWAKIWEIFWDKKLYRDEAKEIGLSWLSNAKFDDYRWQFVWSRLNRKSHHNIVLNNMAYDWLVNVRVDHHGWSGVWGQMWEEDNDVQRLRTIAETWLNNVHKNHKGAEYVKSKLSDSLSMDDKLAALQEKWEGK